MNVASVGCGRDESAGIGKAQSVEALLSTRVRECSLVDQPEVSRLYTGLVIVVFDGY